MASMDGIKYFFSSWDKEDWRLFCWSMTFVIIVFVFGILPWMIGLYKVMTWIGSGIVSMFSWIF